MRVCASCGEPIEGATFVPGELPELGFCRGCFELVEQGAGWETWLKAMFRDHSQAAGVAEDGAEAGRARRRATLLRRLYTA